MPDRDLPGILEFLRSAERLKITLRSAHTSTGQIESVAEHSWRLSLMALLFRDALPGIDLGRLLSLCVIHDLGEALSGDVPAPEQARLRAEGHDTGKADAERRDLVALLHPLPDARRSEILALWDEYEAASSPEARLAKALDKLETILQHTQGRNPPGFDHTFNLTYGRDYTDDPAIIAALRALLDGETARLVAERDTLRSPVDDI